MNKDKHSPGIRKILDSNYVSQYERGLERAVKKSSNNTYLQSKNV